jgi:hypothetical protein
MSANVAAIFGGLLKLYDDIEDIPLIAQYATPHIIETLKALIIVSLTYVSLHDMNLPLIIFIAHFLHDVITDDRALETTFYYAGMITLFILSIITFDLSKWDMTACSIVIIVFLLGGYMDHKVFPEEYSWKKIIWRALCAITVLMLLPFSTQVIYHDILLFFLGYCILSVLLMTCAQWSETSKEPKEPMELKEPKEPKEPKETPQGASEIDIRLPMESST